MSIYGSKYHSIARSNYAIKRRLSEYFQAWLQPKKFADIIKSLPVGAKVIDVGCGQGTLLSKLGEYRPDLELTGIDIGAPDHIEKYKFIAGDVTSIPVADDEFDLVICKQVLEHISNPFDLVRELKRVCKPGALIYLDCPDARGASSISPLSFWDDPTHIRPYTAEALRRIFVLSDMTIVAAGRLRDARLNALGLLYLPIAWASKDRFYAAHYLASVFGIFIFIVAQKSDSKILCSDSKVKK